MKEIINHVEGIFENYDISFSNLNENTTKSLLLEAANAARLQKFMKEKFKKEIKSDEAKALEILFLTYQYVSEN